MQEIAEIIEVPIEPQLQANFYGWEDIPDGLRVSAIWYQTVFVYDNGDTKNVTQCETCVFTDRGSMVVGSYQDYDYFVWLVKNDPYWLGDLIKEMESYGS